MSRNRKQKRLQVKKETLRALTPQELEQASGGLDIRHTTRSGRRCTTDIEAELDDL